MDQPNLAMARYMEIYSEINKNVSVVESRKKNQTMDI